MATYTVNPRVEHARRQRLGRSAAARRRWARDEADFAAVVPLLTPLDRAWLHDAIALTEPSNHPWLGRLA